LEEYGSIWAFAGPPKESRVPISIRGEVRPLAWAIKTGRVPLNLDIR